ncbi:GerAB/ArcD/ProY family transporter [Rossellomorea vietnamensis]|uniref:GerAB/ArcD/ProY family transporter n=2 Tax=Bacillaceae TaxID=186817 RepID=A0A5D4ME14_9BACI|nr:GerAB/ArcD/ProY family transporter [Rossellomorea vietnamensis]
MEDLKRQTGKNRLEGGKSRMAANKLTKGQMFFLLLQSQVGIGILSLPYDVFQKAESDGWISIIAAGCWIQVMLLVYVGLYIKVKKDHFHALLEEVLGKSLGYLTAILYVLYFLSVAVLILTLFNEIIDIWVLPRTPNWIIGIIMVFLGYYLGKESVQILARFNVLVTPILFIMFLLITYALKDAQILYLLPIGEAGVKNILLGSREALLAMLGFEILLVILPLTDANNKKKLKYVSLSNIVLTLSYCYLSIINFMFYSPEELKIVPQPLLYILKSFSFQIIERTDLLFLTIWVVTVFTSFVNYYFLAVSAARPLVKSSGIQRKLPLIFAILILTVNFFTNENNVYLVDKVSKVITNSSYAFVIVIPLILLFAAYIKNILRKEKIHEESM